MDIWLRRDSGQRTLKMRATSITQIALNVALNSSSRHKLSTSASVVDHTGSLWSSSLYSLVVMVALFIDDVMKEKKKPQENV